MVNMYLDAHISLCDRDPIPYTILRGTPPPHFLLDVRYQCAMLGMENWCGVGGEDCCIYHGIENVKRHASLTPRKVWEMI